ncbi:hypothetical protein LIER_25133 [Lithospermum erythrorhizon]|uniref:Uncharacterized protein n=1 Tax=Lithospermum erythrorhizon TaxID=34254 RepID=A0AAV3R7C1_LITER
MSSMMIENLFEKLCSLISAGAEKLVHYVHKVAKSTTQYISRKVSEDLSRLRNLWTLLKASISSAMNYIKEKSLKGFRFIMKWIMELFKWFTDQLVELITTFQNVSKSAYESMMKSVKTLMEKTTIVVQESLLPTLQKMFQNREVLSSQMIPLVNDLIKLCVKLKQRNDNVLGGPGMVDLVKDLMGVFGSLLKLIDFFVEDIFSTTIDDEGGNS